MEEQTNDSTTTATPSNETFDVSRTLVNYVVVAAVFLVIGVLVGALIFGGNATSSGGNNTIASMTQAELSALVRQAVSDAGGGGGGATANSGGIDINALADDDPFLGSPDAPVTIVEFSDFNCAFCQRFASQTLPRILETYGDNIRYVYRDLPIITNESANSAMAAQCAAEQDRFWDFHDLMFTNTQARGRDAYIGFAEELDLDVAQYTECVDTQRYRGEVTLDLLDAQQLGLTGTPGFYVNDRFISGAQGFEVFAAVIDAQLARAGIEPPARDG